MNYEYKLVHYYSNTNKDDLFNLLVKYLNQGWEQESIDQLEQYYVLRREKIDHIEYFIEQD